MICWEKRIHLSWGIVFIKSFSIFTGSVVPQEWLLRTRYRGPTRDREQHNHAEGAKRREDFLRKYIPPSAR
jgi:hypothetical protein